MIEVLKMTAAGVGPWLGAAVLVVATVAAVLALLRVLWARPAERSSAAAAAGRELRGLLEVLLRPLHSRR